MHTKRPTQQVLLKNGAELLFRRKAHSSQAPGRGDARICPGGAEKVVNQGASPHGLCGHQGAREVDAESSPPSSTHTPAARAGLPLGAELKLHPALNLIIENSSVCAYGDHHHNSNNNPVFA